MQPRSNEEENDTKKGRNINVYLHILICMYIYKYISISIYVYMYLSLERDRYVSSLQDLKKRRRERYFFMDNDRYMRMKSQLRKKSAQQKQRVDLPVHSYICIYTYIYQKKASLSTRINLFPCMLIKMPEVKHHQNIWNAAFIFPFFTAGSWSLSQSSDASDEGFKKKKK